MKEFFQACLLWAMLLFPFGLCAESSFVSAQETIEKHIDDFMGGKVRAERIANAKALIPRVIEISEDHGVDPVLIAVMISAESSWLPGVIGPAGELGLLQVHGRALKGAERTTEGLLRAGVEWFAHCLEIAGGDERRAIAVYMTGNPKSKPFRASDRRWKQWKELRDDSVN